jgi:hypothetical protein
VRGLYNDYAYTRAIKSFTPPHIRSLLPLLISPTLVPSGLLAVTAYDSEADTSREILNGRLPLRRHCPIQAFFFLANKLEAIWSKWQGPSTNSTIVLPALRLVVISFSKGLAIRTSERARGLRQSCVGGLPHSRQWFILLGPSRPETILTYPRF